MLNDIRTLKAARWPNHWDNEEKLSGISRSIDAAADALDILRSNVAAAKGDSHLSVQGKQDRVRKFVASNTAKTLRDANSTAATLRADIADRKTKMVPPSPDKGDAAGAAMRVEIRTLLRGLSDSARHTHLFSDDPAIAAAVLEAPGFLSGTNDAQRVELVDRYIAKHYAKDLREIEEVEEALGLLSAATSTLANAASAAGEFSNPEQFRQFVAEGSK